MSEFIRKRFEFLPARKQSLLDVMTSFRDIILDRGGLWDVGDGGNGNGGGGGGDEPFFLDDDDDDESIGDIKAEIDDLTQALEQATIAETKQEEGKVSARQSKESARRSKESARESIESAEQEYGEKPATHKLTQKRPASGDDDYPVEEEKYERSSKYSEGHVGEMLE